MQQLAEICRDHRTETLLTRDNIYLTIYDPYLTLYHVLLVSIQRLDIHRLHQPPVLLRLCVADMANLLVVSALIISRADEIALEDQQGLLHPVQRLHDFTDRLLRLVVQPHGAVLEEAEVVVCCPAQHSVIRRCA